MTRLQQAILTAGALLVAAPLPRALRAQQPVPPGARYAALAGVVVDSLRGGGLANATVVVVGTNRRATTAKDGFFHLDSIEAGEYQMAVLHPLLDTLGLAIASQKFQLTAGRTLEVTVTTPSFEFVRERLCPRTTVVTGPAMLAGRVEDADTDAPLANAAVSIVYVDPRSGSTMQRVRTARTRGDGLYTICGLPATIAGTVQAQRSGLTSGEVPITLKDELLGTGSLTIAVAAAADSNVARRKQATLTGRVVDAAGAPLPGAQVAVAGGNVVATTDADGRFTLRGLAGGTSEAVVRKIGFSPSTKVVHLTNREPRTLAVTLGTATAQTLAAVTVTGKMDDALKKVGFIDRKRMAGLGAFMDPEAVDRRQARFFSDFFRSMPGFSVRMVGNEQMLVATRSQGSLGDCVNVFVDRVPFQQMMPGDLDSAFPAHQIGAIETYASGNDTPAEFQVPGKACATIVAWTKFKLQKP